MHSRYFLISSGVNTNSMESLKGTIAGKHSRGYNKSTDMFDGRLILVSLLIDNCGLSWFNSTPLMASINKNISLRKENIILG